MPESGYRIWHMLQSCGKGALGLMNEKAYKAMSFVAAANVAVGIIIVVVGTAAGIISIICGARLFKEKRGLTF